jgi:hypothetical protein
MDFIKNLMTRDNAITLGVSLFFIGIIIYFIPRILRGHIEVFDQVRQSLKNEAQQFGHVERYNRLTSEEKGISKIPMYGKAMMVTGVVITVTTLLWGAMK